jgi:hypothetical protein
MGISALRRTVWLFVGGSFFVALAGQPETAPGAHAPFRRIEIFYSRLFSRLVDDALVDGAGRDDHHIDKRQEFGP